MLPKKPEYLNQSGRPLLDNGLVTTSCTIVSECLKAGLVDSILKRHFLGNRQRRFHSNDITNSYSQRNVDRRFLHNGGVFVNA
jgi:hypothetical protein